LNRAQSNHRHLQTDIRAKLVPVFLLERISILRSEYNGLTNYHFETLVQNKKNRDEDAQFTWKFFIHAAEVHIVLIGFESRFIRSSSPRSERQKNEFSHNPFARLFFQMEEI
jgi:arginine deiminase